MNLYLRLLKLLLILPFMRRRGLFDESRVRFRVWPSDCDINFHMNNGRYLTFMDLGRAHLLAQTGALGLIWRRRWQPVLAAAEINFIRPLGPLRGFTLVTRVLAWDEKYFYLEHRFEHGDVLCAVAMVKGLFIERGRRIVPAEILGALGLDPHSPEMPAVVRHWNDLTALKKERGADR